MRKRGRFRRTDSGSRLRQLGSGLARLRQGDSLARTHGSGGDFQRRAIGVSAAVGTEWLGKRGDLVF